MRAAIKRPDNNPKPTINEVVCDDCKHEFSMKSVGINEAEIMLGGQQYVLVYFACPNCRRIYRVCLKDDKYNELVEDLHATEKRIRRQFGKRNSGLSNQLNAMVQRKADKVKNHVAGLNRKFPGTFTFAASENNEQESIIYHE